MINVLKNNKKITLAVILLILIIGLLLIIKLRGINSGDDLPESAVKAQKQITNITNSVSPFLKSTISVTNEKELERISTFKNSSRLQNGETEYYFSSPLIDRDDLIVIKQGKVIYERAITVDQNFIHPKLEQYLTVLGEPEALFANSKSYGEGFVTYVWSSQGIAIIANPNTFEVFEVQMFKPSSLDEYKRDWGQDILEQDQDGEILG